MTVKQLKEHLANADDNLEVYMWIGEAEEGGSVSSLKVIENGVEGFPYCKGDKPEVEDKYLLIKGYP